MLQQDSPDDYVVGTGETHSVREFVALAFEAVGLDYSKYVAVDQQFYRPAEVDLLIADPEKARRVLGWRNRTSFQKLVAEMIESDCRALVAVTAPRSVAAG